MTQIQENKLPEGWIETTLGEVCEIIDGDRGNNYPNGDDFSKSGYCLFLNTKNVPDTQFSFSEKMFITKEKDELLRKGKLQRGDFVLTTRGTVGNYAFYSNKVEFDNIRINSGMVVLRTNQDKGFFNFYLKSQLFKHQIISLQSGTAQPQLPIKDLKTFLVILPPLLEQQAIAKILSSFDEKIELLREQNETLEKIGQEIFKEWFGNYKVGDELPEGWKVGKLGDLIHFIVDNRGKTPVTVEVNNVDFIPLIEINALIGKGRCVNVDLAKKGVTNEVYNTWFRKGHPERGDILFSTVGSIGEIALVFDEKICIAQNIVSLRPKVGGEFLFELLNYIKPNLLGLDISTVQPSIKLPHLLDYEIIIPEKILINDFIGKTRNISEKIFQNTLQIQTLSKTRDELLPKLIKGKVRVV